MGSDKNYFIEQRYNNFNKAKILFSKFNKEFNQKISKVNDPIITEYKNLEEEIIKLSHVIDKRYKNSYGLSRAENKKRKINFCKAADGLQKQINDIHQKYSKLEKTIEKDSYLYSIPYQKLLREYREILYLTDQLVSPYLMLDNDIRKKLLAYLKKNRPDEAFWIDDQFVSNKDSKKQITVSATMTHKSYPFASYRYGSKEKTIETRFINKAGPDTIIIHMQLENYQGPGYHKTSNGSYIDIKNKEFQSYLKSLNGEIEKALKEIIYESISSFNEFIFIKTYEVMDVKDLRKKISSLEKKLNALAQEERYIFYAQIKNTKKNLQWLNQSVDFIKNKAFEANVETYMCNALSSKLFKTESFKVTDFDIETFLVNVKNMAFKSKNIGVGKHSYQIFEVKAYSNSNHFIHYHVILTSNTSRAISLSIYTNQKSTSDADKEKKQNI